MMLPSLKDVLHECNMSVAVRIEFVFAVHGTYVDLIVYEILWMWQLWYEQATISPHQFNGSVYVLHRESWYVGEIQNPKNLKNKLIFELS